MSKKLIRLISIYGLVVLTTITLFGMEEAIKESINLLKDPQTNEVMVMNYLKKNEVNKEAFINEIIKTLCLPSKIGWFTWLGGGTQPPLAWTLETFEKLIIFLRHNREYLFDSSQNIVIQKKHYSLAMFIGELQICYKHIKENNLIDCDKKITIDCTNFLTERYNSGQKIMWELSPPNEYQKPRNDRDVFNEDLEELATGFHNINFELVTNEEQTSEEISTIMNEAQSVIQQAKNLHAQKVKSLSNLNEKLNSFKNASSEKIILAKEELEKVAQLLNITFDVEKPSIDYGIIGAEAYQQIADDLLEMVQNVSLVAADKAVNQANPNPPDLLTSPTKGRAQQQGKRRPTLSRQESKKKLEEEREKANKEWEELKLKAAQIKDASNMVSHNQRHYAPQQASGFSNKFNNELMKKMQEFDSRKIGKIQTK